MKFQVVLLLFLAVSAEPNEVHLTLIGSNVVCTYITTHSGNFVALFVLAINTDQSCDVISEDDDCREQLIEDGVIWMTNEHLCKRITGSDAVSCLFDMTQVNKVCCWLNGQKDCYPPTPVTSQFYPTAKPSTNVFLASASTDDKGSNIDNTTTTTTEDDVEVLPQWAGVVITFGILIVVAFIIASFVICLCRMNRHSWNSDPEKNLSKCSLNEPQATQDSTKELSIEPQATQDSTKELSIEPQATQDSTKELSIEPQVTQDSTKELSIEPQVTQDSTKELSIEPQATEEAKKDHRRKQPKPDLFRVHHKLETEESESPSDQPYRPFIHGSDHKYAVTSKSSESLNKASIPQYALAPTQIQAARIGVRCDTSVGSHPIEETTYYVAETRSVFLEGPKMDGVHLNGSLVQYTTSTQGSQH